MKTHILGREVEPETVVYLHIDFISPKYTRDDRLDLISLLSRKSYCILSCGGDNQKVPDYPTHFNQFSSHLMVESKAQDVSVLYKTLSDFFSKRTHIRSWSLYQKKILNTRW